VARKYYEIHHSWLRKNIDNYRTLEDLRNAFNETFNMNVTIKAIRRQNEKLHISKTGRRKRNSYTEEELSWVMANYKKYNSRKDFTKAYETKFNCVLNLGRFDHLFYSLLNIRLNSVYDPYERKTRDFPIGHEMKIHNIWFVKVSAIKGARERVNYRSKAHILYEQYHNVKVNDKTHIVVHLDKNFDNFDKDNLYLISRKVYQSFPFNWHWVAKPKLKKCMFLQTEAKYMVKQLTKGENNEQK
jgi:hypothetical protein